MNLVPVNFPDDIETFHTNQLALNHIICIFRPIATGTNTIILTMITISVDIPVNIYRYKQSTRN